jgi:hypothetical protein
MAKKTGKKKKSEVHKDLEGFTVRVNEFGQIVTTMKVEELNEFLDQNVPDKKLEGRKPESDDKEK